MQLWKVWQAHRRFCSLCRKHRHAFKTVQHLLQAFRWFPENRRRDREVWTVTPSPWSYAAWAAVEVTLWWSLPTGSSVKKKGLWDPSFSQAKKKNILSMPKQRHKQQWMADCCMKLDFCCTGVAKQPAGVPHSICDQALPNAFSQNRCFGSIWQLICGITQII